MNHAKTFAAAVALSLPLLLGGSAGVAAAAEEAIVPQDVMTVDDPAHDLAADALLEAERLAGTTDPSAPSS